MTGRNNSFGWRGSDLQQYIEISKQKFINRMRTQLIITQMKMKNGKSHTMGLILSFTPTQHRDSMQKIRQTHTHSHTHTHTHTYMPRLRSGDISTSQ